MDAGEESSSVIQASILRNFDYICRELDEIVTRRENFYALRAFEWAEIPEYESVILDTYGDNNCLYYCFLFILDVTGGNVAGSTDRNLTKTRVKLLRKQMHTYYTNHFLGDKEAAKLRNEAHFLETEDDQMASRLSNRYGAIGYYTLQGTRLFKSEAIRNLADLYDEGKEYLCKKHLSQPGQLSMRAKILMN